ncbi:MAG: hexokinase family protein, partial [Patescibacteria group bacterium]
MANGIETALASLFDRSVVLVSPKRALLRRLYRERLSATSAPNSRELSFFKQRDELYAAAKTTRLTGAWGDRQLQRQRHHRRFRPGAPLAHPAAYPQFSLPGPRRKRDGGLYRRLWHRLPVRKHETSTRHLHDLAFTFSFPVVQLSIVSGKLIGWTKGFTDAGVEGRDVVRLLCEALERKGLGFIHIAALTND